MPSETIRDQIHNSDRATDVEVVAAYERKDLIPRDEHESALVEERARTSAAANNEDIPGYTAEQATQDFNDWAAETRRQAYEAGKERAAVICKERADELRLLKNEAYEGRLYIKSSALLVGCEEATDLAAAIRADKEPMT